MLGLFGKIRISRWLNRRSDLFLKQVKEPVETRGAKTHVCNIAPIMVLDDEKHYDLKSIFQDRFPLSRRKYLVNSLYRSLAKEERDENLDVIKPDGIMPTPASYRGAAKAYSGEYLKKRRVSPKARNKALMCLAVIKILNNLPGRVLRQNPIGKTGDVAQELASQLNTMKYSEMSALLEALLGGKYHPLANELRANVGPELEEAIETEIGHYTDLEITRLGVAVPKKVPRYVENPSAGVQIWRKLTKIKRPGANMTHRDSGATIEGENILELSEGSRSEKGSAQTASSHNIKGNEFNSGIDGECDALSNQGGLSMAENHDINLSKPIKAETSLMVKQPARADRRWRWLLVGSFPILAALIFAGTIWVSEPKVFQILREDGLKAA